MKTTVAMGVRALGMARGLRAYVRNPVTLAEARQVVSDELRMREDRFLQRLDSLVWPYPTSPSRRLLETAGLDRAAVADLVLDRGLDDTLETLRDAGVYVSYEEYKGLVPARRGSTELALRPEDFFNPVTTPDYMATTGGSRGTGQPMELSFAYQRRQSVTRRLQMQMYGVEDAAAAIWLPVFPSAAGFGAVMKWAAGGNVPQRWFSQVPLDVRGITAHKRLANRFLPALQAFTGAGLPAPEHVPSSDPSPVVDWAVEQLAAGRPVAIAGYASSIAAAARNALDRGIDLTGLTAFPSSEPVTAGKLALMRSAGMRAAATYAFTPEGIVAMSCPDSDDEVYHLWEHELAVVTRRRPRSDGAEVDALLWTSLSEQAPRVLLNVENDDYGRVDRDGTSCPCALGRLGLRTRLSGIRGLSKVVAGGITVDGEDFDRLVEEICPQRLGGAPGDYQFVEVDAPEGTTIALRVHPRLADVDEAAASEVVRDFLRRHDNGVLADEVWAQRGVPIRREPPAATAAGKTLSLDRAGRA